jgi:oligoribonuclease NrnB/cAMP/cGMP phosphodiesterase (DHH superfamily)
MSIDIALLHRVEKIYVHENCADGVASAMILNEALPERKIIPVNYNTELHKNMPVERGVLFCDMSPNENVADAFLEAGAIVLDHHKTSKPIVDKFVAAGLGAFGDEKADPGVCGRCWHTTMYGSLYWEVSVTM